RRAPFRSHLPRFDVRWRYSVWPPESSTRGRANSTTPQLRNAQLTLNAQHPKRPNQEQKHQLRFINLAVLGVASWALIGRCGVVALWSYLLRFGSPSESRTRSSSRQSGFTLTRRSR